MKKLIVFLLVIVFAFSMCACDNPMQQDDNNNDTQNIISEEIESDVSSNESSSAETEKPDKNNSSSQNSSAEPDEDNSESNGALREIENKYRPATEKRISEIRKAKSNIKPQGSGKAYYVSNSGKATNSGLSADSPLATYAQVVAKGLKSGDVIYFKRGDLWRETIEISTPGITLTAYGNGAAPRFYNSPANCASSNMWLETDVPNVYRYKDRLSGDIGAVIFDDKEFTYKSLYSSADQSNSKSKRYVNSYKDLKTDLQMYHDPVTKEVYVCSTKGKLTERFSEIEIIRLGAAIKIPVDNVTVDGLCIKYSSFGISSYNSKTGLVKGLTVRNCEFGWIGGNIQGLAGQTTTRYGNGVEIWGAAEDFTVSNCYFWQVYDAGVTFQYRGTVFNDVKNVKFNNNVFEYCNYSIEYFFTDNGGKVYDFEIKNNHCWYAGEGLCNQRPDHAEVSHIRSGWVTQGNAIKVENNLFAIGLRAVVRTLDYADIGGAYNNNTFVQFAKRELAINGKNKNAFRADTNAKTNIETKLGDKNATIIIIENN